MDVLSAVGWVMRSVKEKDVAIQEVLTAMTKKAIDDACQKQKLSSILSGFRVTNSNWIAFTRRLKGAIEVDGSTYENRFIEHLINSYPELYMICVRNRVFIGHVPNPQQMQMMNSAEDTLRFDRQPRLALRLWNMM